MGSIPHSRSMTGSTSHRATVNVTHALSSRLQHLAQPEKCSLETKGAISRVWNVRRAHRHTQGALAAVFTRDS